MRSYEYLSAAKVEALYARLHPAPRRRTPRLGRGSRSDGVMPFSVREKLAVVEEWIHAHEPVGTPDTPDVWIRGRMPLATTILTRAPAAPDEDAGPSPGDRIFFAGRRDHSVWLLMGGPVRYLTPSRPHPDAARQFTLAGNGLEPLSAFLGSERELLSVFDEDRGDAPQTPTWQTLLGTTFCICLAYSPGPAPEFEFLAQRIHTARSDFGVVATFARPLFVAPVP